MTGDELDQTAEDIIAAQRRAWLAQDLRRLGSELAAADHHDEEESSMIGEGGKPNPGTPKDGRLSGNKGKGGKKPTPPRGGKK